MFKAKHLPVRTILLLQNVTQNNVHSLDLLQTDTTGRPLSIHQKSANCLTGVPDV